MAVNYASKYAEKIDERFSLGLLTEGAVNQDYEWIGVETVNVYSVPTVAMGNYATSGSNRYGTPEADQSPEDDSTHSVQQGGEEEYSDDDQPTLF